MKFTVLGCANSGGVPTAMGDWGLCDPNEPKNRRSRCSLLVQSSSTNLLIDAPYELRTQLAPLALKNLDGVLLTHSHSDHISGLDDIRDFAFETGKEAVDIYTTLEFINDVKHRWGFMFSAPAGGMYRKFAHANVIDYYQSFRVGDVDIRTFKQDHVSCNTVGYRFVDVAYSVDMRNLDERALEELKGLKYWVVDCTAYKHDEAMTHATVEDIERYVDIIKPEMTYLTAMTKKLDYATLCKRLPAHIRPAYDGMTIEV